MRHIRLVVLLLASAGIVFSVGLPWLLARHRSAGAYVANQDATTKEIQDFEIMWTELESLQRKSAGFGPEQFLHQFLGLTTAYLQLDSEQAEEFASAVNESLARLGEARDRRVRTQNETRNTQGSAANSLHDSWSGERPASIAARRDAWSQWRSDQRKSSDLLVSALQPIPRHDLVAEQRLLWLLKLDFSLRNAKQNSL